MDFPRPLAEVGQVALTVIWPAFEIEIIPPHMHVQVHVLFSAGMFLIFTMVAPGVHGAAVLGMHGIGVSTPSAAAVADATVGLEGDMHIPNVPMFIIGLESMMFAAGAPALTMFVGRTVNVPGAAPNVQAIIAPVVTSCGMAPPSCGFLHGCAARVNRSASRRHGLHSLR